MFSKKRGDFEMHAVTVNGEPGVAFTSGGAVVPVACLCIAGGVRAVYMTDNPDKPTHWSVAEAELGSLFRWPQGGRQPGDSS